MALNFEYCECGCKGHEASAGKLHFWIYNDLRGNYYLHQGHGWMSPKIGQHTSFEAAQRQAMGVVKDELTKLKAIVSE